MRKVKLRAVEKFLYIYSSNKSQPNENLVIFIHGFIGNYISTWGKLSEMLQNELSDKTPFSKWDYLFIGYSTMNVGTYLDIADIINKFHKKAIEGKKPFERKYKKFILCGHSLGTLGIRQLLCASSLHRNTEEFYKSLKSVLLFGPPIQGSIWAYISPFFIGKSLKIMNPQMRMLKVWTDSNYKADIWPKIQLYLGQKDLVVGYKSSKMIKWQGDLEPNLECLSHSSLVKPGSENKFILDTLENELYEN